MSWQYQYLDISGLHRMEMKWDICAGNDLPDNLKKWAAFCKKHFGDGGRLSIAKPQDEWSVEVQYESQPNPHQVISFYFKELSHVTLFRLFAG